jgi:DNA invertase Pin-like site-specific DNA recombinase
MSPAKTSPAKTAVGYIRVSTDEQATSGLSLKHQEQRIRAYAEVNGLTLVALVRDNGVSAGKALAERKGGKAVLDLLAASTARHVIALKLDRLFRSTVDALTASDAWNKAGVGLHLVDHGGQSINTASAVGRMFLTMLAGFAEFERGLIRERTKAALATKKTRGEAVSGPTLGFNRYGDRLVENAAEQALIRRIHALRTKGASLHDIAGTLNRENVPTKRGGDAWHASTVRNILLRAP